MKTNCDNYIIKINLKYSYDFFTCQSDILLDTNIFATKIFLFVSICYTSVVWERLDTVLMAVS